MPANTPIYAFTYPCEGEVVTATAFQTLATQIDTQLSSIQLDENYATGRYSSITTAADQAGIVAGVETALTNAGATYVVPADGVYWVGARVNVSIAANLSSARLRMRLNGVAIFGRTLNTIPPSTQSSSLHPTGTMVAVAGDTISMAVLYFGTGPGTATTQRLTVRMIVRTF